MTDDISALKNRLPEFLQKEGIEVDFSKKNPLLRCPDPAHGDEKKSANMYDDERVHCHGCGKTWDIFDIAGLITGKTDFVERKKYVLDTLGVSDYKPVPRKKSAPAVQAKLCPLSIEKAREVYTRESLQKFGDYLKDVGEFKTCWLFKDKRGKIQLVEARYETPEKKSVISIYWDGQYLKAKNYPILMYNAEKLDDHEGPILIVEGAKCAEAAADLPGFLPITWNGGGKKASKVNWSALKGREVYIWPDDDRHKDKKTGEMIREDLQVGMQTAFLIQKKIPGSKIIPPLAAARKIKSSGADIVEALEIKTTEQIRKYILECEPYVKMSERPLTVDEMDKAPFKILGLSDSGVGHVISSEDRLLPITMTAITKTHLLNIADISYWEIRFGDKGKIDWESALNQIIRMVTIADFDSETIRGRGAWIERDGRICYHDGKVTTGESDDHKLYLRKNRKDIGISDQPTSPEVCKAISSAVSRMSFESSADTVRLLGWTALAPFAGALPWRPSGLVTGDHQTGKSAILEYVIKPLASPICVSGGGTTEAGVRQMIANDSAAVCLDESDDDTPMKKRNKQALLSLMRQSTSNDAPIIAKGTKNQTGLSFQMRSMFLFLAISPEIEHAADDSRIFRVNTVKPDASLWPPIRDSLTELITEPTCRGVRARTWGMLKDIIKQVDRVANIIQDETNQSHRFCLSEAMLITAYWMVWQDMTDMTDSQILNGVKVHFAMSRMEGPRDETGEIIDRLLDERILVEKPERRHMTIREMLIAVHKEEIEVGSDNALGGMLNGSDLLYLKNTVAGLGFMVVEDGNVAIASNHHEIIKISGHSRGYNRQIQRHNGVVDASRMLTMAGKYRECIILRGIVNGGEE